MQEADLRREGWSLEIEMLHAALLLAIHAPPPLPLARSSQLPSNDLALDAHLALIRLGPRRRRQRGDPVLQPRADLAALAHSLLHAPRHTAHRVAHEHVGVVGARHAPAHVDEAERRVDAQDLQIVCRRAGRAHVSGHLFAREDAAGVLWGCGSGSIRQPRTCFLPVSTTPPHLMLPGTARTPVRERYTVRRLQPGKPVPLHDALESLADRVGRDVDELPGDKVRSRERCTNGEHRVLANAPLAHDALARRLAPAAHLACAPARSVERAKDAHARAGEPPRRDVARAEDENVQVARGEAGERARGGGGVRRLGRCRAEEPGREKPSEVVGIEKSQTEGMDVTI